jgi:hypothetical protein
VKNLPFFDVLKNEAKLMSEDLLELCDRPGRFKAFNVTFINSPIASKLPTGNYKVELKYYDDFDDDIFYVHFLLFLKQLG